MVLHESLFGSKLDVESTLAKICYINGRVDREYPPLQLVW